MYFSIAYADYALPLFLSLVSLSLLPLPSLEVVDVEEGQVLGFLVASQGVSLMGY